MRLGLTGGIGCGKSTFGRMLEERGWRHLSSDLLAREILERPQTSERVAALFGPGVIGPNGKPDRVALAKIVFSDKAALAALEAELHPRVRERWEGLMATEPTSHWVVEIPLLFEKNLDAAFDFTVCVNCSHRMQLLRLSGRGLSTEEAEARIKAQLPLTEKVRRATLAVFNEGAREFLEAQADTLHNRTVSRRVPGFD